MKKFKLYIFSFACLTLFVLSQSKPFMEWWSEYRVKKLHLPYTRARYGDLYSGCFIPQFMDTTRTKLKEYRSSHSNNTDLYILHDSYLAGQIKKENFVGINKLTLIDLRLEPQQIKLDTNRRNILIIECSERTANWRFRDTSHAFSMLTLHKPKAKKELSGKKENSLKKLFNPFIDQNLEFNLFDYEFLRPLKEIKAQLNFFVFDRIPKDIAVSTDKKYLFLVETVDPRYFESSFLYLTNPDLDWVVYYINHMQMHFKKMGFNEFYFSIIPNPVSVLDRDRNKYNYKIGRIQETEWLEAQYVDVYETFLKSKKRVYRKDDSHWNSNGLQIWVDKVNTQILSH